MTVRPIRAVHGRYDLVAAMDGAAAKARAFLRGAPQGQGLSAEAEGPTPEVALDALRRLIDARDGARLAAREPMPGRPGHFVPRPEEFRDALLRVRPNPAQWAMLRAHARAGAAGLTAGELATAAGYGDFGSANLHYGLLAQAVAEVVGLLPLASCQRPGKPLPTLALAFAGPARPDTGNFVWVMHPELIEALETLP